MAESPKRLGATTNTISTAGSIPNLVSNTTASTWTAISSIVICNTGASAYTYTISTSSTSQTHGYYIAYSANIAAYDSVIIKPGIILDPTNAIYLIGHVSNSAVNISVFGMTGP